MVINQPRKTAIASSVQLPVPAGNRHPDFYLDIGVGGGHGLDQHSAKSRKRLIEGRQVLAGKYGRRTGKLACLYECGTRDLCRGQLQLSEFLARWLRPYRTAALGKYGRTAKTDHYESECVELPESYHQVLCKTFEVKVQLITKVYCLLEPRPVVLVIAASKGRANIMAMSWHTMMGFEPPIVGLRDQQPGLHVQHFEADQGMCDQHPDGGAGGQGSGLRKYIRARRRQIQGLSTYAGSRLPGEGATHR
jgi:hypothetical protein